MILLKDDLRSDHEGYSPPTSIEDICAHCGFTYAIHPINELNYMSIPPHQFVEIERDLRDDFI